MAAGLAYAGRARGCACPTCRNQLCFCKDLHSLSFPYGNKGDRGLRASTLMSKKCIIPIRTEFPALE